MFGYPFAVMTSHSREQDFLAAQHSGDNSLSALRYPSGVPETFPHRGELHEEVHAVGINPHTKGDRLNFRFKETLRDSKDHDESSTVLRPQVTCLRMLATSNHIL